MSLLVENTPRTVVSFGQTQRGQPSILGSNPSSDGIPKPIPIFAKRGIRQGVESIIHSYKEHLARPKNPQRQLYFECCTPEAIRFTDTKNARQHHAISNHYNDSKAFACYMTNNSWIAPYLIAYLVLNGPLQSEDLDLIDVGCHYTNILEAINRLSLEDQNSEITLGSYTGIDISEAAISTASRKHPEHSFIAGDATSEESYYGIQEHSKNLITCCGVTDYLPPSSITKLLKNLDKRLSFDANSRTYITFRTTCPSYGLEKPTSLYAPLTAIQFHEVGIPFYTIPDPSSDELLFFNYHPQTIKKIVDACGFEIDEVNSISCPSVSNILGSDYDYICLRRKQLQTSYAPTYWDMRLGASQN